MNLMIREMRTTQMFTGFFPSLSYTAELMLCAKITADFSHMAELSQSYRA